MKVVIVPETRYIRETDGVWEMPGWSWWIEMDNGRSIAKGNTYAARGDAIGAALRVLGLALPTRIKGSQWRSIADQPQPRGGTANVYVIYGSGGKVTYAQWLTTMEYIELVER
jgi:hypothetical protein